MTAGVPFGETCRLAGFDEHDEGGHGREGDEYETHGLTPMCEALTLGSGRVKTHRKRSRMTQLPPPQWPRPVGADRCPCLSGETFGGCCEPLLRGESDAPTALRLMRSRYTAFVVGSVDHLLRTWHPSTRPRSLELDPATRWFRLDIHSTTGGGPLDTRGTVDFEAHYRHDGLASSQREHSRFVREHRLWSYVDAL